ncbi:MAG: hypothetical protein ABSC54_11665 [Smithellaceae bacterium]
MLVAGVTVPQAIGFPFHRLLRGNHEGEVARRRLAPIDGDDCAARLHSSES